MRKIRRLVFLFAGFETHDADTQRARFAYAARKTGTLWNASIDVGALTPAVAGCPEFHVASRGAGWAAETDVVVCDWSDLIAEIERRNPVRRCLSGLWALASFILNGTFFRYVRTSWRYGLFFLYPLLLTVYTLLPLLLILRGGTAAIAGALLSALLFWFFSKQLQLTKMFDNWTFARAAALERDAGILSRSALFKTAMLMRIEAFDAEGGNTEVLIAAHSLGASFAALALGGALAEIRPGRPAPALLTAGSSLLKIALHPKAVGLREAVGAIARSDVRWLDVQSLTDILNFYRADPAAVLGISPKRPPVLQFVRFRTMLTPQTYRRIKFNLLRVHRQFVLAAERRTNYSFHMMLAGPYCLAEIMENRGLPQAFVETAEFKRPNS
jgi:hypothetical protein